MHVQPQTEQSWFPPYLPITTELEGLDKIECGMRIIWFEITEGNLAYWRRADERITDDGFLLRLGIALATVGVCQLRVPIIVGIAGYIFSNYFT